MNAERKAAILAGMLYFQGIIAGALSVVPIVDVPDYFVQISQLHAGYIGGIFPIADDGSLLLET